MTVPELIQALLENVPALRPLYEQHIQDYDELLSHVFFGDVSRLVEACFDPHILLDEDVAIAILAVLEAALEDPSDDVDDLIGVSFIENVSADSTPRLRAAMGPRLHRMLVEYLEWRPLPEIDP
jgi:hypothetical protein